MKIQIKRGHMVISVLIVLLVVSVLVFITINKRKEAVSLSDQAAIQEGTAEIINMENEEIAKNIKISILKEGTGEEAKAGDTVAMNYSGTLADGTTFDSNVDPKFQHVQPFVFTLGIGQVIKGWDVGVAGMKVGEKRKLEIAPDFAYGSTGAGGVIPPNATLTFEVELLGIKE